MKQIFFTLVAFFLLINSNFGQNNPDAKRTNIWYFGHGAGLDFSSGIPIAITDGSLHTDEGTAVMADIEGNLLFYTDGDTVWNKNHIPMLNGTGLLGCGEFGSSSQAALIVPQPQNDSIYYVFTTDCAENDGASGFRYSIININLDNGNGAIISKNIFLHGNNSEMLGATIDASNNGFWIMTHRFGTNEFIAYHLTELGLSFTPIISEIGFIVNDYLSTLRFSPNGKKIALANPNIFGIDQLFDFDNQTGQVYNLINLSLTDTFISAGSSYNMSFSSDNSKLFCVYGSNNIYQYCLNVPQDSASISSTGIKIAESWNSSAFWQIQNSPDGKILITSLYTDSISFINYPNKYGTSVQLNTNGLYLGGRTATRGLPNFVQSFFEENLEPSICDSSSSIIEVGSHFGDISIFPNPSSGNFTLDFTKLKQKSGVFEIFDEVGKLLLYKNLQEKLVHFSYGEFKQGIYIVKVTMSNNQSIYKKLIIN